MRHERKLQAQPFSQNSQNILGIRHDTSNQTPAETREEETNSFE